ncbi:MAG: glycosyltransferase, partial [Cyclobacteriaceae bacterium]
MDISLVIPAKDEEESIPELSNWISRVMQTHGLSSAVLFIDDGSTEGTWEESKKISTANPSGIGSQFSRN